MSQKKEERCTATQVNRRSPDFECKIMTAHGVHIDPRTGQRWGAGKLPRGFCRRWKKNYGNPKLHRQSATHGRAKR